MQFITYNIYILIFGLEYDIRDIDIYQGAKLGL